MLVLSRKVDQQIMIGDDVTLTIVRVEGNRVRVGISAPREMKVLRGELVAKQADQKATLAKDTQEFELSDREFAFADPNAALPISSPASGGRGSDRLLSVSKSKVFAGTVTADGNALKLNRVAEQATADSARKAPLSAFVNAS